MEPRRSEKVKHQRGMGVHFIDDGSDVPFGGTYPSFPERAADLFGRKA